MKAKKQTHKKVVPTRLLEKILPFHSQRTCRNGTSNISTHIYRKQLPSNKEKQLSYLIVTQALVTQKQRKIVRRLMATWQNRVEFAATTLTLSQDALSSLSRIARTLHLLNNLIRIPLASSITSLLNALRNLVIVTELTLRAKSSPVPQISTDRKTTSWVNYKMI